MNKINNKNTVAAIILAAGKGKRMNSQEVNKVMLPLSGRPMISYAIDRLKKLNISPIIIVVGFAKNSVMDLLKNEVIYAIQRKQLGTGHAVKCALKKLSPNVKHVLVLQGDDSAFYKEETLEELLQRHILSESDLTFLTIELDNPAGLGRVIRDENDRIMAIIEEKDASLEQKRIKEINPACYVFKVEFLREFLKKISKSKVTGEYYLPSLIDIAIKNNKKIEAVKAGKMLWRGINTKEELDEAEKLFIS